MELIRQSIDKPRPELSKYAPKIVMFNIDPDKIGDVIGKQGKVINKIVEDTGVKIDIEEDGRVFVAGIDPEMIEKAKSTILSIVKDPEIGDVFEGPVVTVRDDLGAFVELAPGRDGMVHIAKLAKFTGSHLEYVSDLLCVGDTVKVEVVSFTKQGKIDLKLLEIINQVERPEKTERPERRERPRSDRPGRSHDRPRGERKPERPRRERKSENDGEND